MMGRPLAALALAVALSLAAAGCGSSPEEGEERNGPPPVWDHVHDADCGHVFDGAMWSAAEAGHVHGEGCGHHLYDAVWWTEPPHVPVALEADHVCTYTCGHYLWHGRMVLRPGHVHGRDCGHRYTAGVWMEL